MSQQGVTLKVSQKSVTLRVSQRECHAKSVTRKVSLNVTPKSHRKSVIECHIIVTTYSIHVTLMSHLDHFKWHTKAAPKCYNNSVIQNTQTESATIKMSHFKSHTKKCHI